MSRIYDTPDLFDVGIGHGTSGDITCDFCGQKFNEGADASGRYLDFDSVSHTRFAGKTVCFCCFEKIEDEVLVRMPDILKWYAKIIASQQAALNERKTDLQSVTKLLNPPTPAWVPVHKDTDDVDWDSMLTGGDKPGDGLVEGWTWKQVELHVREQASAATGFPKNLLPDADAEPPRSRDWG